MDTLTCIALARELSSMLRDMYVHGAEQADAGETLLLHMKGKPGSDKRPGWLVLSGYGGRSFLFFTYKKPEINGRSWPSPLSEPLQRLLVRSVSHSGMDRRMKVTFASSKAKGERREMFLELFAAKPRAYLVDADTAVIAGTFGVRGGDKTGTYTPSSPPKGKLDPIELDTEVLEASLQPGITQDQLVERYFGVSKLLAREAIARAELKSPARKLKDLVSAALKGKTRGYLAGPSEELGLVAPHALTFPPHFSGEPDVQECSTVNDAVRKSFLATRNLGGEQERRKKASKEIRADLKRLLKTRGALEEELHEAGRAGEYRRVGELILSHIAKVSRGLSEVELPDEEAGGGMRRVVLDPRIAPAQNAAAYFKKARKFEKKVAFLPGRIAELAAKEKKLQDDLDALAAGRLVPAGDERDPGPGPHRSRTSKWPVGISPRRFTSSDGWTMYVGRSNKENDYITFAFAKPNDLWFHAHGVPGSHVVLRREGRKANPSKRCVEETAAAAAYFSKARTSNTVAVIYTEKKYVRKPRKGKAGTALCSNEQTVMVAPKLPEEEEKK